MKKLLTFALATTISSYAYSYSDELVVFCSEVANIAETTMHSRQRGVEAEQLLTLFKTHLEELDEHLYKASLVLLRSAYSEPKFNSASYQQIAVSEFKNNAFIGCLGE